MKSPSRLRMWFVGAWIKWYPRSRCVGEIGLRGTGWKRCGGNAHDRRKDRRSVPRNPERFRLWDGR